MKNKIWLSESEPHDFLAAGDYLDLLFQEKEVKKIIDELKRQKTVIKKAKDILRASQLPLLPRGNTHVKANLKKVNSGKKLSPVLLVRHKNLIIADGYHRVCSIYYLSEDLEIPCRIAHCPDL